MSIPATAHPDFLEPLPDNEIGPAPVATLSLRDLRERRRRLLEESARTAHWHRLAKARLDLVVAGALAGSLDDSVAAGSSRPVGNTPCFASMRDLLLGDELPGDVVDRLRRIDDAERRLRGHGSTVRAAADEATVELVRRYRDEPATCLAAVPDPV